MNVSLPPEQEQFVADKVANGSYDAPDEIVREGLRLVMEQDSLRQMRLNASRRDIDAGLESLDRGGAMPLDLEEIKAEGMRLLEERRLERTVACNRCTQN